MEQTHGAMLQARNEEVPLFTNIGPPCSLRCCPTTCHSNSFLVFLSAFIEWYQVSRIRNQTMIGSSQLLLQRHLWNAPWEVSSCAVQCLSRPSQLSRIHVWYMAVTAAGSIAGVVLCQLHQEQTRQGRGMCLQQAICCKGCGAWLQHASYPLLKATPNHRNVASCLGPQKNKSNMQFFQHLVACKLLNHGMIQPFKNSTSYV